MRRFTVHTAFFALALIGMPELSVSVAKAQNNVTFRVNMSVQIREGKFDPSADVVRVAGSFNDWGNSKDTLSKGANDNIYTKTVSLLAGGIEYKFLKTLRAGSDWESGNNRQYTVASGAQTLPAVWFDNDSIAGVPVSGTNLFAGTWDGVFLSTNNGTSWTQTSLTDTYVWSLAVSPDGAGGTNLFAGTDGRGVFLSTNNGTSWAAVNTGLTIIGVKQRSLAAIEQA